MSSAIRAEPLPGDVQALYEERWGANYVIDTRDQRGKWFNQWRYRQMMLDLILSDDFSMLATSKRPEADKQDFRLRVQNLVKASLYDVSRLCAESQGSIKMTPIGAGEDAADMARLYSAIAQGYHIFNRGERMSQTIAGDLWGHSFSAILHYVETDDEGNPTGYPRHIRLDPHGCLPNIVEDRLVDLLYSRKMPAEQADARWPTLNLLSMVQRQAYVEVIEFFSEDRAITTLRVPVTRRQNGTYAGKNEYQGFVVQNVENPLDMVPISWSRFYTGDGRFDCPVLDGAAPNDLMNQATSLLVDIMEQAAYSSIEELGALNPNDFGPFSVIHLDPAVTNARYARVPPAQMPQAIPYAMQMWESQARNSVYEPAQRQGEIPGSIYSGSAIGMSTGAQTSLVRSIQREMGYMRERGIEIDFAIDRMLLDEKKPLLSPAGNHKDYRPSKDIPERYLCEVQYGAAAGLDTQSSAVLAQQLTGNLIASRETARGWIPGLGDTGEEATKVMREQAENLLFQGVFADADPQAKYLFAQALGKGVAPLDAVDIVLKYKDQQAQLAQQAAQAQAGPQGGLPPGLSPEQVATQNLSLQKGGVPGTAEGQAGPAAPGAQGIPNLPPLPPELAALGGLPGPAPQALPQPFTTNQVRNG